LFKASVAIPYD